ncbi:MAG: HlyD family efflux transporter periplasmic adaptor subunit [Bacteroidota bacterium]|nr:HlyD family efflux transporter periplasmic adaptor subunit [Bacteroidota bacterium]
MRKINTHHILLGLSAILLFFFTSCNNQKSEADAYGNFETEDYVIASEAQGKCLFLGIQEGDKVQAGEIIARIDTSNLSLQIKQLLAQKEAIKTKFPSITAQVEVQETKLESLKKDKSRISNMLEQKAATQKQLDDIITQIQITEKSIAQIKTQNASLFAELNVIDSNIDIIRDHISKATITAPANATVLDLYIHEHELLAPGKPIAKLADMEKMTLKAWISGDQLAEIKIGKIMEVRIDKRDGGFYTYEGNVSHIASKAEFTPTVIQTKDERIDLVYAMDIKVKNDGRIKIGMPAEVVIR